MPRAYKRAKFTVTSQDSVPTTPPPFINFHTGPSLEHVPDDILLEILSNLPTLDEGHVLFGGDKQPPVIPSHALVRTPTLRVISRTSRVLRSRCLAMAWQSIELCSVKLPDHGYTYYNTIGKETMACLRVLKACSYLLPLIRTVTVCFTRYRSAEILPVLAECLASLPNLAVIQVIHAHPHMAADIQRCFAGKQFPSVRKIYLPPYAHEVARCCRNVEEVVCVKGEASITIIGALIKGGCDKLRIIKGISAPFKLKPLVKLAPNLECIGLLFSSYVHRSCNMKQLCIFRRLNTIEIVYSLNGSKNTSREKEASKILKENKSKAEKRVIIRKWKLDSGGLYMVKEVIQV